MIIEFERKEKYIRNYRINIIYYFKNVLDKIGYKRNDHLEQSNVDQIIKRKDVNGNLYLTICTYKMVSWHIVSNLKSKKLIKINQ